MRSTVNAVGPTRTIAAFPGWAQSLAARREPISICHRLDGWPGVRRPGPPKAGGRRRCRASGAPGAALIQYGLIRQRTPRQRRDNAQTNAETIRSVEISGRLGHQQYAADLPGRLSSLSAVCRCWAPPYGQNPARPVTGATHGEGDSKRSSLRLPPNAKATVFPVGLAPPYLLPRATGNLIVTAR